MHLLLSCIFTPSWFSTGLPAHPVPAAVSLTPPHGDPFISLHDYFSLSLQELKLPVYRGHSPQIGMRRYFADLLAILSNRYQLCPTARHLAVYLLDLFMDHYDVAVKQLYVIALTCLLLASKCIFRLHLSLWFLFLFCFLGVIYFFYLLNLIKMWMPQLL